MPAPFCDEYGDSIVSGSKSWGLAHSASVTSPPKGRQSGHGAAIGWVDASLGWHSALSDGTAATPAYGCVQSAIKNGLMAIRGWEGEAARVSLRGGNSPSTFAAPVRGTDIKLAAKSQRRATAKEKSADHRRL